MPIKPIFRYNIKKMQLGYVENTIVETKINTLWQIPYIKFYKRTIRQTVKRKFYFNYY
jgi:hypothetical protein